jgi:hypothetical protein
MEKFIRKDSAVSALFTKTNAEWILTPNNEPNGSSKASNARHHGDFDNDDATLRALLARLLGQKAGTGAPQVTRHLETARVIQSKLSGIAAASTMRVMRS